MANVAKEGIKVEIPKGTGFNDIPSATQPTGKTINQSTEVEIIKDFLLDKYCFRFDEISMRYEQCDIGKSEWHEVNESSIVLELLQVGMKGDTKLLRLFLLLLTGDKTLCPHYNPIQTYFERLSPFDRKKEPDYLRVFCNHIKVQEPYFLKMFIKHLMRSIACGLGVIPFNKQCLVFIGGQNCGKSTLIRYLCPPFLDSLYKENPELHTKDGRFALSRYFILNFDELAGIDRKNLQAAKSSFTASYVNDRMPYAKKDSKSRRVASFFGSTDKDDILTDEAGNVRWLLFNVIDIDFKYRSVPIDRLWAQVYAMYLTELAEQEKQNSLSYSFELTKAEVQMIEATNKNHMVETTERGLIQKYVSDSSQDEEGASFMTTTDIAEFLADISKLNFAARGIGIALKSLGFTPVSSRAGSSNGKPRKGFWVKVLPTTTNL